MIRGRALLIELSYGLGVLVVGCAICGVFLWMQRSKQPTSTPPPPGATTTGEAAARLRPKAAPPPPLDGTAFAKLPAECGCALASTEVQLRMHVKGTRRTITPSGNTVYVTHDVAIAKQADAGEQLMKFPPLADVAPGPHTEGFAARFDLACQGNRMIVADAVHVTMWDLEKRPRRIWSTALPARRGDVVAGTSLAIECHAAKIEDPHVIIDPAGTKLRLRLADGKLEP